MLELSPVPGSEIVAATSNFGSTGSARLKISGRFNFTLQQSIKVIFIVQWFDASISVACIRGALWAKWGVCLAWIWCQSPQWSPVFLPPPPPTPRCQVLIRWRCCVVSYHAPWRSLCQDGGLQILHRHYQHCCFAFWCKIAQQWTCKDSTK